MNRSRLSFLFLIFLAFPGFSQSIDSSFYDYGWLKMMRNGEDFRSITAIAQTAYNHPSHRDKAHHYQHYIRWENFWQNRVYSSPEDITKGKYGLFYHHSNAMNANFGQAPCLGNNHPASDWESWGFETPPLYSDGSTDYLGGMGVMWCVKIDTSDHSLQTIYAGSPLGGLWKTTDQGNNWFNVTNSTNLPFVNVSDIAIDPRDNQHLLISTGAYWSMNPVGIGILESFDGGLTWGTTAVLNNPVTYGSAYNYVDKVYFHPSDSNKYFMMTKNHLIMSPDRGATWADTLYSHPDQSAIFTRLIFHPTNHDTLYLSSREGNSSIVRSTNGGTSWQNITSNFTTSTHPLKFTMISVSPTEPDNLYAIIKEHFQTFDSTGTVVVSTEVRHRIYKSTDAGNSSSTTHTKAFFGGGNNVIASNKSIFDVSPSNDDYLILGGVLPYTSTDGGHTLSNRSGVIHNDMRGMHFVDGLVAVAHDGGISFSTDNGATWSLKSNGLVVQQPFGHDVDINYTYLLAPMQDIGFYRYDIPQQSWSRLSAGGYGEGGTPFISDLQPNSAVSNAHCGVSSCNFGVIRYAAYGTVAQHVSNLPIQAHSAEMRPFAQDHNGAIYTGMEDVFKSTNYGGSWTKITDFDGTGVKGDTINDHITAIATSKADTNLMAIGFLDQSYYVDENRIHCDSAQADCPQKKFFVSKDGGATWIHRTTGTNGVQLPIEWVGISDVIISPHDAGKIWVTMGGFRSVDKVYFSPDTGNSWYNHTFDFPNLPIHSIVYQENSNDRLYASTDVGVWTKDASTNSWQCYNNNLPAGMYVDLDVNNCGGALTVSGHGRGIWKSPLAPNRLVGNLTWDGHRTVGSDLIVADTLTITGTVEMAYNTKITVEPGGKLILDGGTLTSSHCIDSLWQGIELLGNSTIEQYGDPMESGYPQGYVHLTNGAVIEHAEVGIYAGSYSQNDMSGGRIAMEGSSSIRDCRKGVVITHYELHNLNQFTDVSFENTGNFNDPLTGNPLLTEVHVSLDGTTIVGNQFAEVTFKNHQQIDDTLRGIGIELTGRRLGTTSEPFVENSVFENLNYGMKLGNLSAGVGNDIEHNQFILNQRGIYVLSGFSVDIENNYFELAEIEHQDVYAIMTVSLENFSIQHNSIKGSMGSSGASHLQSYGVVVENSGRAGGLVFDNQMGLGEEMDVCIQAQGDNSNLTLRCNELEYSGNQPHAITVLDYVVVSNGQILANVPAALRDQGHPNCRSFGTQIGDDKAAAGNKFTNQCSGGTEEEIDMTKGVVFKYYFHTRDRQNYPTTEPDCADPNWTSNPNLYIDCSLIETQTSCNAIYTPPVDDEEGENEWGFEEGFFRKKSTQAKSGDTTQLVSDYVQWYRRIRNKKQTLESNSNGTAGTATLLAQVQSGYSPGIQQQLMAASPLSEALLLATVEAWAGTADSALKSVLQANVPLEKSVWASLHQQQLAAPWSALLSMPNQHPLRDTLVRISHYLRFAQKELQLLEARSYRSLMADSSHKAAEALLDSSLLSASLRLLFKDDLHRGAYQKAYALLQRIKSYAADGELTANQEFASFYETLLFHYALGKSEQHDPEQAQELNALRVENTVLGAEAEAWLQSLTGSFAHHPIVRKQQQLPNVAAAWSGAESLKHFQLFPNPNSGAATLHYELAGDQSALWQLYDVNGKLLKSLRLPAGSQQKQFKMNGLANGVYHFVVSLEGERLINGKMVVTQP